MRRPRVQSCHVSTPRENRPGRAQASDGWSFDITASFVEIYNDTLRDLLCPPTAREGKNYRIVQGQHGRFDVTDLEEAPVTSFEDVTRLMNAAQVSAAVRFCGGSERRPPLL